MLKEKLTASSMIRHFPPLILHSMLLRIEFSIPFVIMLMVQISGVISIIAISWMANLASPKNYRSPLTWQVSPPLSLTLDMMHFQDVKFFTSRLIARVVKDALISIIVIS